MIHVFFATVSVLIMRGNNFHVNDISVEVDW